MYSKRLDEHIKRLADAEKKEKQYQWQAIKQKAPEIANFMIEFEKVFGKPAAFEISVNDEIIATRGFR